jgi:excisionase family DNA binding protein
MDHEKKQNDATLQRRVAISAKELAEMLSVSRRTVWRLLSTGRLPKPVSIGGSKRFLMSDVNLFLESNCDMAAYEAGQESQNANRNADPRK